MSTDRLHMNLANVGYDAQQLAAAERVNLQNMYAEYLLDPPVAVGGVKEEVETPARMTTEEIAFRKKELALRKQELEIRKLELERLKSKVEKENKRRDQEHEIKTRELDLWAQEMKRQRMKDESLAGLMRHYGEALKHAMPKMRGDPTEYRSYFRTVENLFANFEVPACVQAKLLIPVLTEHSKTLLARLPKDSLDDYTKVRDYLLREFRLTPENYRDKFWSATKNRDETFTLFGTRVKTLFQYYLDSRKTSTKEDIIDLMVSDRIKQVLPEACLKHVISMEGLEWYHPDKLTSGAHPERTMSSLGKKS